MTYTFGKYEFAPSYLQAALIVFLIFLLILTFARLRYLYVNWSLGKSSIAMVIWGFILAVIVEGFLMIGGNTLFTEILGWEKAPKPISTILNISRNKLVKVMGASTQNLDLNEKPDPKVLKRYIDEMSSEDRQKLLENVCKP